ncbi:MAG TPA: hypothetical protein VEL76_40310 [Gemmataceae bacterium]|nr:hypothetical protein [Gemmataceae bacterium]
MQLLEIRFGVEAAKEFQEGINGVDNLEQLDELHKLAATSRRVSKFRRAFPQQQP